MPCISKSIGAPRCTNYIMWSAVAQSLWLTAGLAIVWARVRIPLWYSFEDWAFSSLHWLSCINEYLAIYSGRNVSDLVLARNCCMARMLPGEAELVSEWTGLPGKAKSVKRFERSNGLDTALYANISFIIYLSFLYTGWATVMHLTFWPAHCFLYMHGWFGFFNFF